MVIAFMQRQADLIEAEGHDVTAQALKDGIAALQLATESLAAANRDLAHWKDCHGATADTT